MSPGLKIIQINPVEPEEEKIALAASIVVEGGVIGYPTETIYGLGCDALNKDSVERIFKIKGRDLSKPFSLIISDQEQLQELAKDISEAAHTLMARFWPGPLTLIFPARERFNPCWLGQNKTIAARLPSCPICLCLVSQCKIPIVSTSANLSGSPNSTSAEEVLAIFSKDLDLLIDGGPTHSDVPSTILDCSGGKIRLIRSGAISVSTLEAVVGPLLK